MGMRNDKEKLSKQNKNMCLCTGVGRLEVCDQSLEGTQSGWVGSLGTTGKTIGLFKVRDIQM